MNFWKKSILFSLGGYAYMVLELFWRGWSHGSMFLAGGLCFLLLGQLNRIQPKLPLPLQAVAGAGIITMVEYAAGLVVNRQYTVWDYRDQPLNYHGQICFGFCLLWIPIGIAAMYLYDFLETRLTK